MPASVALFSTATCHPVTVMSPGPIVSYRGA